jgi:GH15 family glucan-1,4-alpha-glucosidase
MILTLTPIFLDERFHHLRTKTHEDLIGHLAKFCMSTIAKPDAGLWEIRDGWQEHSFSNLMNWAGIDRVMRIQKEGYLKDLKLDLQSARLQAENALQNAVTHGVLTNGPKDLTLDASLLQLPILRYPNQKISDATVTAIMKDLCLSSHPDHSGFVYRYKRKDDFGSPQSAFVVCSFWLVQALASIGRVPEAKRVMGQVLAQAPNSLGLLSEHYLPETGLQCGNFPQAYSHVGLINAAFAISPSWEQIL